jgi:membrane-associated phospholipid phosphatase
MSCALVYLGEHYVVDIIAGTLCVLIGTRIAYAIDRRMPPLPERRPLREPARVAPPVDARVPVHQA